MKEKKEVELIVRSHLSHIVMKGAYEEGSLKILADLYFQGADDVRNEVKDLLGVEDCPHDY